MPYQIQVRGQWAGAIGSRWRPAVAGTMNQTTLSDSEASLFDTHDAAQSALDWMMSLVEDERLDATFRIVLANEVPDGR